MNNKILSLDLKRVFPKKIHITNSVGNWELNLGDIQNTFPRIQSVYHHSTPELSDDVLTDGEPDYLGIDIHFVERGELIDLNVDITYGDAMMFSFKIKSDNSVEVGHYNGYGSKFDSKTEFYFQEQTINEIIGLFEVLNPNLDLKRKQFNFLDGDKTSFKMEKVRWISDFESFNRLNRL